MNNAHRLPVHIKPERYGIMLKPDLEQFTFEGEEVIELVLNKGTKEIILHSAELKINFAEFLHQDKNTHTGKIKYDERTETVTLIFPANLQKGKGKLKLKFTGILNDKMRGFYRSKYIHEGKEKYLATTQFESTDARRSFPCFDEPSHKAIFDITLIIPKGLKAISNTIESEVLEHESGYQVLKFVPTPKMSTYLLALIVGDFESIEGVRGKGKACLPARQGESIVRIFTTPGKKEQARFALEVAIKCLDFYEEYFGIDYPLPVLDMVAIPDFAAGAMENWGAVTYRESTILIDAEKSSSANKQWVALVIAHELAHQWFGNLVTMKWWTHLWLNEGFASFIEYLAVDHIFPQWDIWTQFVSTDLADAFSLDGLANTHPIEVEVGHPAEISEIFDRVSYSKGASVLRMLWKYLGEKDFQKGLQFYLKKYAYGNAETQDLWDCLEKVSKKPVGKIMKNWTGKAGHPLITVRGKGKGERGNLELTQSRFFSSPISRKESKDRTIWNIPLVTFSTVIPARRHEVRSTLGVKTGIYKDKWIPDQVRNDTPLLMNKKTITIPNTGGKINAGEVSLVRVDYPHEYLKKLEKNINKLSAADRLGLIRDSFDLAQSGNSPTTLALELTWSYIKEDDYIVWSQLTNNLGKLESLLALEPGFENFKTYGRKIYQEIANKIGWEKKNGEKHTDALLRSMVLYKLGSYGDEETIKRAQELFFQSSMRAKGGNLDPDLRGVVYNLVAENGGQKEWSTLVKMYKREDNQQEKDRLGRSLGLFKQKTLLEKTLEFAISKDVRFQNTLGIIASTWHNPTGRYLAWEFVKKNWKMLKERYAGGHYFTRVFGPASEFTKIVDAKDIESFVMKNPVPEASRTIAQVLEQIYSNVEWLKRDREKIAKFLSFIPGVST